MPKLLLSIFSPLSDEVALRRACSAESWPLRKSANYSLESAFIDICTHTKKPGALLSSSLLVPTHMVKKFEGAHWKRLLDNSIDLLLKTFTVEASRALKVLPEQIRGVEFRLGSLYVTFNVTHDGDASQEEMSQRIEEHPFSEMWRLYSQFNGATTELDALGNVIRGLEEQLAQKDIELESIRRSNEKITYELTKEVATLRNILEEVEDRERNLVKELEKEREARIASEAQPTASKEENQGLAADLENTKNYLIEIDQKYKKLIAAMLQENRREREARERELKDEIIMKNYIIQNLEAKLTHLQGVKVDQHRFFNRNNGEASSRLTPHIEELLLQLQRIEKSEVDVHSELECVSESLRIEKRA